MAKKGSNYFKEMSTSAIFNMPVYSYYCCVQRA